MPAVDAPRRSAARASTAAGCAIAHTARAKRVPAARSAREDPRQWISPETTLSQRSTGLAPLAAVAQRPRRQRCRLPLVRRSEASDSAVGPRSAPSARPRQLVPARPSPAARDPEADDLAFDQCHGGSQWPFGYSDGRGRRRHDSHNDTDGPCRGSADADRSGPCSGRAREGRRARESTPGAVRRGDIPRNQAGPRSTASALRAPQLGALNTRTIGCVDSTGPLSHARSRPIPSCLTT